MLDDFGFAPLFRATLRFIAPIMTLLFPEWSGDALDHHHAFVVRYAVAIDEVALDKHMDQSETTLNVCLGKQFVGGAAFFGGVRDASSERKETFRFAHRVGGGNAIVHVGQHWHGAEPIVGGERYNLILWGRATRAHASALERSLIECERETFARFGSPPVAIEGRVEEKDEL